MDRLSSALRVAPTLVILTVIAGVAGCSGALPSLSGRGQSAAALVDLPPVDAKKIAESVPEADKARTYWANAFANNPQDERAAIGYARVLKAMGDKEKAMGALQQAAINMPDSRVIASEQGRLALEMDQLDYAEKMLARADDPKKPDWRVLSAKGTLSAKRGEHKLAAGYFERARQLAPSEPSVLNNLALAYALDGRPGDAEALLKDAATKGGDITRIRQNLALVLGVQGKFDEAKQAVAGDLEKERADANIAYLQKMVKATPVALAKAPAKPAASATEVVTGWATEATVDAPAAVASVQ